MKNKLRFLPIVLLWLLLAIISGCKKNDPNTPDPIIDTKTKVIVMDTVVVSKKLDDISTDGTLKFTGLSTAETPKKGDIICSSPATNAPLGFLYKVKDVTKVGNTTTITTELATVEEAIQEGEIHDTIDLVDKIVSIKDGSGNIVEYSKVLSKAEVSGSIKLPIETNISLGNNVSCKLEGKLEAKLSLIFDLSIKDFDLKWLAMSVQAEFISEVKAGIEGTVKDSSIVPIHTINFEPIKKFIPVFGVPVPIVIYPKIIISAFVDVEGKISFMAKIIDIDYKYTYGVKYESGSFSIIKKNDSQPVKILEDAEVSLSGKYKSGLSLDCIFKFYNQEAYAGIYTDFYSQLSTDDIKLDANVVYGLELLNPKIQLSGGISFGPQAVLTVFSKKIIEWRPEVFLLSWQIWERAVFPEFSSITFENPTKSSVIAKCEIEKLAYSLFYISQHGFCWGQGEYPSVDIDGKNQLGVINNLSTFGKQSMSAEISGLKANTTYTIRPYFTSWLGTFYAEGKKFTTLNTSIPTVATSTVTNITSTSATVGGNVTGDGGGTVTERGIYWGTNLLVNGTKLQIGSNTGVFSTSLTGLTTNTTYYIKAYAINSQGTGYGDQVNFTTGVIPIPIAAFTATPTTITPGQSVQFTDQSTNTPTSWFWNFGDGSTATTKNPSHTYASAGTFTVILTATNSYGYNSATKTNYITVNAAGISPVATFTATPTTITAGQSVQFTDQSTNTPTSWSWTFGDGGTSTSQNTSHTYASAGTYTVALTATNSFGSNTQTKTNYITVNSAGGGIIFNPNLTYGSVTDIDGNDYKTIQIGNQTWMAENLKVTRYNNSDKIPTTNNYNEVVSPFKYQWPCNLDEKELPVYGRLYTAYVVLDTRNVCPIGWHVPTTEEWYTLGYFVGGLYDPAGSGALVAAGGYLKESGTTHWKEPNAYGTNKYGFTALPAGSYIGVIPDRMGEVGYYLSSTNNPFQGTLRDIYFRNSDGYMIFHNSTTATNILARSIRCIKD